MIASNTQPHFALAESLAYDEDGQEGEPADQDVCFLRAAFRVAEKVGEELERSEVLF